MKNLILLTSCVAILAACSPNNHANSAQSASASSGDITNTAMGTHIPAVATTHAMLYDKTQCVQGHETYCAKIQIEIPQTQIDWLDNLLKQQLYQPFSQTFASEPASQPSIQSDDALRKQQDESLASLVTDLQELAKDGSPFNEFYESTRITFVHQRGKLAAFQILNDGYSGGAHNNYSIKNILVDLEKRQILRLTDMVQAGKLAQLDDLLQKRYDDFIVENDPEHDGQNTAAIIQNHKETFAEKAHMDNFMLTADGLTFDYSPYEIASYANGTVSLTIDADSLKDILLPEYLP